ncbi:MAG: hypothetical protein ACTJLM_04960 [Ehrlichia sp.]
MMRYIPQIGLSLDEKKTFSVELGNASNIILMSKKNQIEASATGINSAVSTCARTK